MKYWFKNDYSFGANPRVLYAVVKANLEGNIGYGFDKHSDAAKQLIRDLCGLPDAAVEFFVGGTQTNVVACSFLLKPWEAAITAVSGHLNGHEVGAFEATGHKILAVESGADGKLTPELIAPLLAVHEDVHLTKPALVYISNSTENGFVYTKAELTALYEFCHSHGLYLFIDGARLGCALTSNDNDLTLKEFSHLADAFYIGGTKNGALFGEALVIPNGKLAEDFFRMKKRSGAVIEKGWIQGVMFYEMLRDGLYFDMARNSNEMAQMLQSGLMELGWKCWVKSPTNQLFFIVPKSMKKKLDNICEYEQWCEYDNDNVVIRFVTCFNTTKEDIEGFLQEVGKLG